MLGDLEKVPAYLSKNNFNYPLCRVVLCSERHCIVGECRDWYFARMQSTGMQFICSKTRHLIHFVQSPSRLNPVQAPITSLNLIPKHVFGSRFAKLLPKQTISDIVSVRLHRKARLPPSGISSNFLLWMFTEMFGHFRFGLESGKNNRLVT
jgi:hypothetical protein